jgi:16S rRNA (guanine527-N7)-methyltransferase
MAIDKTRALAILADQLTDDLNLENKAEKLLSFLYLLVRWRKTYNLVSQTSENDIFNYHIADSISIAKFLPKKGNVLDVGTGPGLPGIPLAIARPDLSFVLLDSRHKRTTFLQYVVMSLSLDNVKVVRSRIEDFDKKEAFATVISRAFSNLQDFVMLGGGFCQLDGEILAMKGRVDPSWEQESLQHGFGIKKVIKLQVPGIDAERCLVVLSKQQN